MSSTRLYRFLTSAQIKRLHSMNIALGDALQPALLESAATSPINHKYYGQTDLFQLAGILAEKVILNHAFQDGNKRTALFAADMFLKMNGYELQRVPMAGDEAALNEGLANAHVSVATKAWSSEELGRYYAGVARPLKASDTAIEEYKRDAVEH